MALASAIQLSSELMTFKTSTAMHETIDHFHAHIDSTVAPGGIALFSNTQLPPTFYIPGGHFFIAAENIIFRIHAYFFNRDSLWWQLKHQEYNLVTSLPTGKSCFDPIPIPSVTAKQLASMLWVIYNPYYGLYNTSDEEWAQIAMAAGQLGFKQIVILTQVKGRIR